MIEKIARWREYQPRGGSIIAEERLEQCRKAHAVRVESGERAKNDHATDAKVWVLQRPEIDQRIIVAPLSNN